MPDKIMEQLETWHAAREHGKICDAILALPEGERTDELVCLLARALSNLGDYKGALEWLDGIESSYQTNPYYCFRKGFALDCLHREDEALLWMKKASSAGLEDINEMPGSYYPKSVRTWVERMETWAPRRTEANAFEKERRAKRNKIPLDTALTGAALAGLWDDCDYSLKSYVGAIPTDEDIAAVETELGYRLPHAYKTLIKQHNGGLLARNCFPNPLRRDWTTAAFSVESLYGIDRDKTYSLCGDTGSQFWISEWGYPDIGVAICGTMSGGHDMIFLDYSDCGANGEPCVVQIDQEGDYEISYLADDFASFVRGLVSYEDEDDDKNENTQATNAKPSAEEIRRAKTEGKTLYTSDDFADEFAQYIIKDEEADTYYEPEALSEAELIAVNEKRRKVGLPPIDKHKNTVDR